jgi:HPt (histidine-containing phosphotransfer) domain-containing protein
MRAEQEVLIDSGRMAELASLGDPSLVRHVVDIFFNTVPDQLRELHTAAAQGDASGVRNAGHTIKGGAASAGFPALSQVAAALEDAGRDGHADQFAGLIAELEDLVERTRRAADEELA